MKKIYILSLCALLGASATYAGNRFKTKRGAATKLAVLKKAGTDNPIWRPVSQTDYSYMDGEWELLGSMTFGYDSKGNTIRTDIESEDGILREETSYDEFNKPVFLLTTQQDGEDWVNVSKRTYIYDPVVHDFYTERLGYDWTDGEWVENFYCETNAITRNAEGNIIEIVKSLPLMGEMKPGYKSVWNYDETSGEANEFMYFTNTEMDVPDWQLDDDLSYRNLLWAATDGQMTETSLFDMVEGSNRIASADVYMGDELDGHIFVEYSDENPRDYLLKQTYADLTVGATTQKETIDENGSYRLTDMEYFDEDGEPTEEPTYISVTEVMLDSHGNTIMETLTETYEGLTEMVDGSKADYTYDDNGNPTEILYSYYDYDEEDFVLDSKTVFGEYADASSGIENVVTGKTDNGFKVYNLQGILILDTLNSADLSSLPAGLYIINGKKHLLR